MIVHSSSESSHSLVVDPSSNIAFTVTFEILSNVEQAWAAIRRAIELLTKKPVGPLYCYVMPNDCFFFIDDKVPLEQRKISVLCVKCHDDTMPETGMFYEGSKEGYGPFNYKCCLCGTLVHADDKNQTSD